MNVLKKFGVVAAISMGVVAGAANAHDIYIWPTYFTVNQDKPTKVAVDVTASHTTFRPDFAMPSHGVSVYGVDGKKQRRLGGYFESARRSTFDLAVEEEGTYKLTYNREPSYFTSYELDKKAKKGKKERKSKKERKGKNRNGKKWLKANKTEAKSQLPKGAKNVETSKYTTVAMSFLTNKAPTSEVLELNKKGFEVLPVTHPSDYVTGEDVELGFYFDGEALKDVDVIIEQEGPQYRAEAKVYELKSNEDGLVSVNFDEGGRYMLKVNHKQAGVDPEADYSVTRIFYAFEVIYE